MKPTLCLSRCLLVCALLFVPVASRADFIDFEGQDYDTPVGTTYNGVTFSGGIFARILFNLSDEFPPRSGEMSIFDEAGSISIQFANPIRLFRSYFTYVSPLALQARDSSGNVLFATSSLATCSANFLSLSGGDCNPNERIDFQDKGAVTSVVIDSGLGAPSFTMDDLEFEFATAETVIPEPSHYVLLLGASIAALVARRKRAR
jgi:hypothetical protein